MPVETAFSSDLDQFDRRILDCLAEDGRMSITDLAKRVGFRVIPGLSERVIYRELFPKGLTLLDLKAIGAHNVTAGRPQGMSARATLAAVERNYERWRSDGRLPATFEVVYGHAWAPQPRTTADGRPIIPIKAAGGRA